MSCKSRQIGVASVHSRMYIRLAHSTSADSHSVFVRLRVRFDSSHEAYVVHNSNGLYRRTSAETAWIRHACASRGNVDQRGAAVEAVSGKTFRTPPSSKVEKGGVCGYKGKNLFPKIASPIASGRFGPSYKSDPGAHSIATSQIHARAACVCIGRDASDAHGRACSGSSAWRPTSVKKPLVGVGKVAHPDSSGFPTRMRLRSSL
jgi:hypothetical protein